MRTFLNNINFEDLKVQKTTLIEIAIKSSGKEQRDLEAIICLIDALQDEAVENYDYKEDEVFDLEK